MSRSLRRGYEHLAATGELLDENYDPEFVWDMSTFRNWPERQTYEGIEGAREFLGGLGRRPGRTGTLEIEAVPR